MAIKLLSFEEFMNLYEEDISLEDKELVIDYLNSYETKYFKISNVFIKKENIFLQLDFYPEQEYKMKKSMGNKIDFLNRVLFSVLDKTGLFIDKNDIVLSDNNSDIQTWKASSGSEYYVYPKHKISVIIKTSLNNVISTKQNKKMNEIIDKKIKNLEANKKNFKTIEYILRKIFIDYPSSGIEYENFKDGNNVGFLLDPKNKFSDLNKNIIVDLTKENNFKKSFQFKGNPLKQLYLEKLLDFFNENYRIKDYHDIPGEIIIYPTKTVRTKVVIFFK